MKHTIEKAENGWVVLTGDIMEGKPKIYVFHSIGNLIQWLENNLRDT